MSPAEKKANAKKRKTSKRKTAGPEGAASKTRRPQKPDQMDQDVIDFITAIDDYKRIHSRPFPNWSEVLEIVKSLGYEKAS